jgi:hypothetical protein
MIDDLEAESYIVKTRIGEKNDLQVNPKVAFSVPGTTR